MSPFVSLRSKYPAVASASTSSVEPRGAGAPTPSELQVGLFKARV